MLLASAAQAATYTGTSFVQTVRMGAGSPVAVGMPVTFTVEMDDAITGNPANDTSGNSEVTNFHGALSIDVAFSSISFEVSGGPNGSGAVPGNTSLTTRDVFSIDSQVGVIGRRGVTGTNAGGD